jgi:hypothetical protein
MHKGTLKVGLQQEIASQGYRIGYIDRMKMLNYYCVPTPNKKRLTGALPIAPSNDQ